MKILLTGGGSGGHFYPIIAVAAEINAIVKQNHLLKPELYYMSTEPYNEGLLYENGIIFRRVTAGKVRTYFSILNFIDIFKMAWGVLGAIWTVFRIYPDVIFSKGAYASFPALCAARVLGIPVVIHESDSAPGRVNKWAASFAQKIALSYPDGIQFFPAGKTAYTGNPIRREIMDPLSVGAHEFLHLDPAIPTVLILGGSQGSQLMNEVLMDALPELVAKYQVIHQTGPRNIKAVQETAEIVLRDNIHKDRYKPFDYLNLLSMRMAAGIADIVVSRAGSTIFEIASWGRASIIIPITNSNGDHQRKNAYSYARTGAAEVIEEKNLTEHILVSEIDRIVGNPAEKEKMAQAALGFARRDAATLIAQELLDIALSHEK